MFVTELIFGAFFRIQSNFLGLTLGMWSLITSIGSAAYGAYSSYAANSTAAKQAEYNADYEKQRLSNEAEQEAMNREAVAREERSAARRRRALMEGRYAKSGLLLTGTPADYLISQAQTDEFNALEGNRISQQKQAGLLQSGQLAQDMGSQQSAAFRSAGTTALIQGLGSAVSAVGSYGLQSRSTTPTTAGTTPMISDLSAIQNSTFFYS